MAENTSSSAYCCEKSFFGDTSYNMNDLLKSQKDSSNPEKEFNSINNEIKKVTEGSKGSIGFSSDIIETPFTDQMFETNIWKKDNTISRDSENGSNKFFEKFEMIKNKANKLSNKNNNGSFFSNNSLVSNGSGSIGSGNTGQKKLTFPSQGLPISIKNKNKKNNNLGYKNNNNNTLLVQNLPKCTIRSGEGSSLLERIKEKVNNEHLNINSFSISSSGGSKEGNDNSSSNNSNNIAGEKNIIKININENNNNNRNNKLLENQKKKQLNKNISKTESNNTKEKTIKKAQTNISNNTKEKLKIKNINSPQNPVIDKPSKTKKPVITTTNINNNTIPNSKLNLNSIKPNNSTKKTTSPKTNTININAQPPPKNQTKSPSSSSSGDSEEEWDNIDEEANDDSSNKNPKLVNKVTSINVQPNFINGHYYTGSGFSYNSTTSNNSNIKKKCITESDDFSIQRSYLYDPPYSGRSNNSGNTQKTAEECQNKNAPSSARMMFGMNKQNNNLINNLNNVNNNCYKFDTSGSGESGTSPRYYPFQQVNQGNVNVNQPGFLMPMNLNQLNSINALNTLNKLNTLNAMSNLPSGLYKQPFSLNTQTYYNKLKPPMLNLSNLPTNTQGAFQSLSQRDKEKKIIRREDIATGRETRTTLMIRNLPIKYTTDYLEKELEAFKGKYDCIYLPFDFENGGNKGYAFINLVHPLHILLFYEMYQDKSWTFFESKKICHLNFAVFQGIEEIKKNAKNYRTNKKPTFYINTNNDCSGEGSVIEIPRKYLTIMRGKYPNMRYTENKMRNTFILHSLK